MANANESPEMKRLTVDIAICMACLDGQDNFGTPESTLYILLGSDIERWNRVRHVMVNAGFVTISNGNAVKLTTGGAKLAPRFKTAVLG